MKHILLLLHLLMLMAGTASAVYLSAFIRKSPNRFLRDLLLYTLSFMGTILVILIFMYINLNLLELDPHSSPPEPNHPLLLSIAVVLAMLGEAGMAIGMMRCMLNLRRISIAPSWIIAAKGAFVLFALSVIWGIADLFHTGEEQWIEFTYMIFMPLMVTGILLASFLLVLPDRRPADAALRLLARSLGRLHIAGYGLCFASLFLPGYARGLAINSLIVGLFLIPLVWCRLHYLPYTAQQSTGGLDTVLAALVAQNRISPRERDIIERIVKGMSNKEIKADLNIAYSTVKNHLYNIYQKLNVSSRAQLIHLLLSECDR
jgi:DNA-binding CsgD family transcriptional regulator